jgi:hypothetical protein
MQQLYLLDFFSHDYDNFGLSITDIRKSFGIRKNRADVVKDLKVLEALGYLTITDDTYKVNLDKIHADYKLSIAVDDDDDSPAIIPLDSSAPKADRYAIIPSDSSAQIPDSPAITNRRNVNENTNLGVVAGLDISTVDEILGETTISAKQHNPPKNTGKQNTPSDIPTKDHWVYGNSFKHQGFIFAPAERLHLWNDQYSFSVGEGYTSYYYEPDGVQVVVGLYNQLLNKDIMKYHRLTFWTFEQMLILSHLVKLKKEKQQIPRNREELQTYVSAFNLDNFDAIFDFLKKNDNIYMKQQGKLTAMYSNLR